MEENYLKKASDPHQYDSAVINWEEVGLKDSPTRLFFQEYLENNLDVKGKSVVDIGSGMGQLFSLLNKLGATSIKGVEPSINNVRVSKKLYPDIDIFTGTIQEILEKEKFDAAVSILVFEHITNLSEAFNKIHRILKDNSLLYLIVYDKEYDMTPRFNYNLSSVNYDNGITVVKVTRPSGTIYDILRPLENYIKSANQQGFSLEKSLPLKPSMSLINAEPKYTIFKDSPIAHLLILKKKN